MTRFAYTQGKTERGKGILHPFCCTCRKSSQFEWR